MINYFYRAAALLAGAHALLADGPQFQDPVRIEVEGEPIAIAGGYTFPAMVDLDGDKRLDLVVGYYRGAGMLFYKNIGTSESPSYAPARSLMVNGEPLVVPGVGP